MTVNPKPRNERADQLIEDKRDLQRFLQQRIEGYPASKDMGPGDDDAPVSNVVFGYSYIRGWAAVIFDTREGAPIDLRWTGRLLNGVTFVEFPSWPRAWDHLLDGQSVEIISSEEGGVKNDSGTPRWTGQTFRASQEV